MRNNALRSCKNYVNLDSNSQIEINDLIEAYSDLLVGLEKPHWQLYLVTLGFNQMGGNRERRKETMRTETVNMFNKLLTRFFRRPRSKVVKGWLPVGVFMFDMPVRKTNKRRKNVTSQVLVNDGLHVHGIIAAHPFGRIQMSLEKYFVQHQNVFRTPNLSEVDVRQIHESPRKAAGYAVKGLKRFDMSADNILILPRD